MPTFATPKPDSTPILHSNTPHHRIHIPYLNFNIVNIWFTHRQDVRINYPVTQVLAFSKKLAVEIACTLRNFVVMFPI